MDLIEKHQTILDIIKNNSNNYEAGVLALAYTIRDMCLKYNGKVIAAGNGGSAAQSEHFVAELVGRYKANRQSLNAVSLTANTATITAIANDFGFENVFARQLESLVDERDVVVLFTTSGKSQNIINAAKVAYDKKALVILFTGDDASHFSGFTNYTFSVPYRDTAIIQEVHLSLIHAICEELDDSIKCLKS